MAYQEILEKNPKPYIGQNIFLPLHTSTMAYHEILDKNSES